MLAVVCSLLLAAPDIVVADFEGDDYGDWTVEGTAFGTGPARGTLPGQMPVSGYLGRGLVNSYAGGDGTVGRLTSPEIRLERDWLNFLIGGGQHPDETCCNLLVDGRRVLTATGPNDRPGGSERLAWVTFDLRPWRGRLARIELVDAHRGGWGHLNADQFELSDTPRAAPITRLEALTFTVAQPWLNWRFAGPSAELLIDGAVIFRAVGGDAPRWAAADLSAYHGRHAELRLALRAPDEKLLLAAPLPLSDIRPRDLARLTEVAMDLPVTARYLLVPIRNGAPKQIVRLHRGETLVQEFDAELAGLEPPDWWAFYDLGDQLGATLRLTFAEPLDKQVAARLPELLRGSDQAVEGDDLYREALRPQFHFTSRRGWNNDPNGLVYLAGTWHLFYQHNPFGIGWGNMHWGHATSPDLVRWIEQPVALRQRGLGDMAFSGGGNVDLENTAGWQVGDQPVLFVSFTSTGRGECLAYSTDGGATFREADGNPVLRHSGRDPKIVWYAPQRKWVMVVYDEPATGGRYAFWESRDLKTWTYLSAIDGLFECPDMFELPLDGDPARRRWVLYGHERRPDGWVARASYLVGRFDGTSFVPETPVLSGHLGPHFYAAQTFSNAPGGRVVQLGWLAGASYPDMPFSQGLTVPLELGLITTPEGPRMTYAPAAELASLRTGSTVRGELTPEAADAALGQATEELLDLALELEPGAEVVLGLRGQRLSYADGILRLGDQPAPVRLIDGALRLRVLLDRSVLEVFAGDGTVAFSVGGALFDGSPLTLTGATRVRRLEIHALRGIWP